MRDKTIQELKSELKRALWFAGRHDEWSEHDAKCDAIYDELDRRGELDVYSQVYREVTND